MAIDLGSGQPVCFNTSVVVPPTSCGPVADLVFQGGLLKMPQYGVGWRAVSGPFGNGALPAGRYTCTNLRPRTKVGMVRDGVGFSVDLIPQFATFRTDLRIHPDGNVPGTEGCIGITEDVAECYEALKGLLPNRDSVCELDVEP